MVPAASSTWPMRSAALGIDAGVPYIGYTFSQHWAEQNPALIEGFVAASRQARCDPRDVGCGMAAHEADDGRRDDAELERLRDWYRRGIPRNWGEPERHAAAQLFDLLAKVGGPELVGSDQRRAAGTFWPVTWRTGA